MVQLKRLNREAIPAALEKAERYRMLNEPRAAESICLDVLDVDADDQRALVLLLLSRTDQFAKLSSGGRIGDAEEVVERLSGEYERAYYSGIVCERWAKALITRNVPGCGAVSHQWITKAIGYYESAEGLRAADNDDPILRYNACVRFMERYPSVRPDDEPLQPTWADEA